MAANVSANIVELESDLKKKIKDPVIIGGISGNSTSWNCYRIVGGEAFWSCTSFTKLATVTLQMLAVCSTKNMELLLKRLPFLTRCYKTTRASDEAVWLWFRQQSPGHSVWSNLIKVNGITSHLTVAVGGLQPMFLKKTDFHVQQVPILLTGILYP